MSSVDIIVPVYGAASDLAHCLASIEAETDLARHGLILVIDGPQDRDVELVLATAPPAARVLRNEARRGFVGSVNRGMELSTRDVILLNSDTIVTRRWVEKMIEASVAVPKAGTVTPLSNHATLCSVPRAFEENLLPTGQDATSFAALVERVSERRYPLLPTAVGVCMWIGRSVLDEIGLFDAVHFGLGYGEENDFCMRASARGWVHVADDATFIQHAGHRSFRSERAALMRNARRTLARLHPRYMSEVAKFMKLDPLAPVRESIVKALREESSSGLAVGGWRLAETLDDGARPASQRTAASTRRPGTPQRVVHLVHGWPPFQLAGTELYAKGLVARQSRWRDVAVFARLDDPGRAQGEALELEDDGVRVRLVTNNFTQRNPLARNAIADATFERDFARFLRQERPDLVHVHHLAGHAFSLPAVARRMGIPILQQLQDWWSLCARVNLTDAWGSRCSGPGIGKCARCAPLTAIAPAELWSRALHWTRRAAARRALAAADAYVMGSESVRDDHLRARLLRTDRPALVLPYGVEVAARGQRPPAQRPLRFGFVGSDMPHKGLQVAREAFREIDPALATLTVWGSAGTSFLEEEKGAVFASMDVLVVPSIGLESFGLTAREAMACGVPVVATADGALLEMPEAEHFPSGDAAALRSIVLRLAGDPAAVDAWSRRLPEPKSVDEHAVEIEELYARILAARR